MKSVDRLGLWVEPWLKLGGMAATFTPGPTRGGVVAPVSGGAEPLLSTWERGSWKTVWLDLKPTVFTLAMLLPTVSSLVWWALRPEMAENMERNTGVLLGWGRGRSGTPSSAARCRAGRGCRRVGGRRGVGRQRDLGDPAQVDGDAVDDGLGLRRA